MMLLPVIVSWLPLLLWLRLRSSSVMIGHGARACPQMLSLCSSKVAGLWCSSLAIPAAFRVCL